jgi:imidazole glycerol-phosphate synthase subunit HisF
MLKVRVMPILLWSSSGLVKGVSFNSWRRIGSILPTLNIYNARDVDELVLLNVRATLDGEEPDYELVRECSPFCSLPLTVGGGITSVAQIAELLKAGADKISLNSSVCSTPQLVDVAAGQFGVQCIVASIDARATDDSSYRVMSKSGTHDTGRDPVQWAMELADRGAGEILLTSIDRDGTMEGYDLALIESIASRVNVPVIAAGGAGTYQHLIDAVQQSGASAVAAASMFQFTEQTPNGAKQAMRAAGIAVRLA